MDGETQLSNLEDASLLLAERDYPRLSRSLSAMMKDDNSAVLTLAEALHIEARTSSPTLQYPLKRSIIVTPDMTDLVAFSQGQPIQPQLENVRQADNDTVKARIPNIQSVPRTTFSSVLRRQGPTRVMIVGDSMSQGQQGDWTWRYRIWQWFKQQGSSIHFVGPYTGTLQPEQASPPAPPPLYGTNPPPEPLRVTGGYAKGVDQGFLSNSEHFSVWGRAAATGRYLIHDAIASYPTDLMLLFLGFNDMGWFYSGPTGTLDSIRAIIDSARSENPDIKFAIANVPQRTNLSRQDLPTNIDNYNILLENAIPQWSTPQSPIVLVDVRNNYQCNLNACPAGYDGIHPRALGEYQIARAFSIGLVDLHFGTSALQIPENIPARDLPLPSSFQVNTSPQGVTAIWDAVYGAYSYDIRSRIPGVTDWSPGSTVANRFDQTWPVDGSTYEIQIRANAGDTNDLRSLWTAPLSAVARPQTPKGPRNVVIRPTSDGFDISWDPSVGPFSGDIIEYNILHWDRDDPCAYVSNAAFKQSPASIRGLNSGHRYLVAPEAWNSNGEGFPEMVNYVRVNDLETPLAPEGLSIVATDSTSIYATWDVVTNAAGYRVWSRDINQPNSQLTPINGTVSGGPCSTDFWLYPGTWNYEFAVSSFNGNNESPPGTPVVAPHPAEGARLSLTCPLPPPWCANGKPPFGGPPEPISPSPINSGTGVIQSVTVVETGVNGQPSTVVETLTPIITTNAQGQTETIISIQNPGPSTTAPPGAIVTTITVVGPDGRSTIFVQTLYPFTTTNSQGQIVTSVSTGGAILPQPGGLPSGGSITVVTTTDASGKSTVITETIKPTTATDAHGSTVIGTVTIGPSSITAAPTGLITYSTFPSDISWSSTSVESNTHDGSGHPVLGPWPGCWFCPPGSHGIVLSGIGPGVYPGGGPPAGLPTPFPPLTILPMGDPEYPESESETPTSSSESCARTLTATDVTYFISIGVDTAGSRTATTTYSTASGITQGCSVTPFTTKITTSGSTSCAVPTIELDQGDDGADCGAACNPTGAAWTTYIPAGMMTLTSMVPPPSRSTVIVVTPTAAAPSQTSSTSNYSVSCISLFDHRNSNGLDPCQAAYHRFVNSEFVQYMQYTSYYNGFSTSAGFLGCAASFQCQNYDIGMNGQDITAAFDYMFTKDRVPACGSSYLSNGCRVSTEFCQKCTDVGGPGPSVS